MVAHELLDAMSEFARIFADHGVPYAMMGGVAAHVHGLPRPTFDVDFTIDVAGDQLSALYNAAENAGFHVPVAYRSGWIDRVAGMPIVKLGMKLGNLGIDVDVFIAECEYQHSMLSRRIESEIEGHRIWLVSAEDLIVLKAIAYRDRDKSDIQDVLFMQGQLDTSYMRHWADQMGVLENLEEALRRFRSKPDARG